MSDDRLDAALAEYLAACDAGQPPDRAAFLAQYPELASFLDDHERLRAAVDPEATVDSPTPRTIHYIGDYEVLGEIARGGMGVVYRVRQISANRLVALKMILTGAFAGEAALRRFRIETEAAANLDHPNILPIYEVGDHEGRPYFSMKLAAGGSLKDRIDAYRADARATAALLAKLARAVHYAHQRGILHRDLKPGNVLLDGHGEPLLADFGLAKQLERPATDDPTQSGTIVGTPAYMPPEQARGDNTISTAADVYSLGAILYHCLTGRPPFRAATTLDTLLLVLEQEPPAPTGTDPDLAVIALKCLRKNPGGRYASAADLADDLDRWQRGEPIHARPVGTLESAVKWVRRNALVTALLAAVLLTLISGVVVSVLFALKANERAEQEAEARREVGRKNSELDRTNGELAANAIELRQSIARSLLRPLALTPRPGSVLSLPEIAALEEIAAAKDERLRQSFLEEALRTPVTTRQLRDRAAPALHALLGLNLARHATLEPILVARWEAAGVTAEERTDLALLLSVGRFGPEATRRAAGQLALALARPEPRPPGPAVPSRQVEEFLAAVERLPPTEAVPLLLQAFDPKTPVLDLFAVIQRLGDLAPRLGSRDARRAAQLLGRVCAERVGLRNLSLRFLPILTRRLERTAVALLERLDPADMEAAARDLIMAMATTTEAEPLLVLTRCLETVLPRLAPAAAAERAGEAITRLLVSMEATRTALVQGDLADSILTLGTRLGLAVARPKYREAAARLTDALLNSASLQPFAYAEPLRRVTARLEPRVAATLHAEVAAQLLASMARHRAPDPLGAHAQGLALFLPRLEPTEAAAQGLQAANLLLTALEEAAPNRCINLARGLAALAPRLKPADAALKTGAAVRRLLKLLEKPSASMAEDPTGALIVLLPTLEPREAGKVLVQTLDLTTTTSVRPNLVPALFALALRLNAEEARAVVAGLLPLLARPLEGHSLPNLAQGFTAVLRRLEPGERGPRGLEAAAHLLQALPRSGSYMDRIAEALVVLGAQLPPAEAGELAERIAQALGKSPPLNVLRALALALAGIAARPEVAVARAKCDAAAQVLLLTLSKPLDGTTAEWFAQALDALCAQLPPATAAAHSAAAVTHLLRAIPRAPRVLEQEYLGRAIRSLAQHMDPEKAPAALADLGERLLPALARATKPFDAPHLAEELVALSYRLPNPAAAALLVRATAATPDPDALTKLTKRLADLPTVPDAKLAGGVAEGLLKALPQKPPEALPALAAAVAVLARGLPAAESRKCQADTVRTLLDALRQATRPADLALLAAGLADAAPHLDPATAASACAEASTSLLQTAEKVLDVQEYRPLARGLMALAPHLTPAAAAALARGLLVLQARRNNAEWQPWLTLTLRAVCQRHDANWRALTGPAVTTARTPGSPFLTPPAPPPLPVGTLAALAAFGTAPLHGLPLAAAPLPPPLPVEALVGLLKEPLCYGPARQVILDELGRHYGRRFADPWDFVRFAEEHRLDVDLASPPKLR